MDSSVLLDYALFQLTPTRTRCDLIVFHGGKPEKLASGLCEPFVSHLKFAKDEFAKGGYSIKLCPPSRFAPWFTKSTFLRFVRFVSTPAVLERFIKLESEIMQIDESSAQANELLCKSGEPEKGKKRNEESPAPTPQENSKVQFQRLLETRKSMLRREQAMAYARGLVAGFEPDKLDDLISFADAFGASRLKQACVNFKELCQKKNGDGLWMKELAAMEAYSPAELAFSPTPVIVLTNEALDGSVAADSSPARQSSLDSQTDETSTAKAQMGMPWPNQMIPPYMYNFQHLNHPYQGYPYPPVQPYPPQYAMNMQSPPTSRRKSSPAKQYSRKGRSYSTEESEEEESSGSESIRSDSESEVRSDKKQEQLSSPGDDVPVKKKHHRRKSSSKTVVIKNINYITSKKRNGALDNSFSGEDEGKLVNQVVESLEEKMNTSKNEDWDAFQNLLTREEEQQQQAVVLAITGPECPATDLESSEKLPMQKIPAGDSFLMVKPDEPRGERASLEEDFMVGNQQQRSVVKKRMDSADEDLVISRRVHESGTGLITDESLSSSMVKPGKGGGEDWFVIKGASVNKEAMLNGDYLQMESNNSGKRESTERDRLAVDDSFMLEARPLDVSVNQYDEPPWRTDIAMAADLSLSSPLENGDTKERKSHGEQVDDLCMVVEREAAWCTDQSMDLSFMEATNTTRKSTNDNPTKEENQSNSTKLETKNKKTATANHSRVHGRTRTEMINSRTKRTTPLQSRPLIQKSKLEREDEARKMIEELALQRQKRIAERTAAAAAANSTRKQNPNRKS
ncbi:unnamed protein product [Linum trigynum]|uniref:Uncharacterized protein n=1 Tax=Linum trigynum TaxID=586398 RepID=A0AAV2DFS0_9ROSI